MTDELSGQEKIEIERGRRELDLLEKDFWSLHMLELELNYENQKEPENGLQFVGDGESFTLTMKANRSVDEIHNHL